MIDCNFFPNKYCMYIYIYTYIYILYIWHIIYIHAYVYISRGFAHRMGHCKSDIEHIWTCWFKKMIGAQLPYPQGTNSSNTRAGQGSRSTDRLGRMRGLGGGILQLVGGLVAMFYFPFNIGNNHPNLTNSYFSEGWPNHQPDKDSDWRCISHVLTRNIGISTTQAFGRSGRFIQHDVSIHISRDIRRRPRPGS